jgi:sodium/hydrogen exchanger-like protein 6/7
VYIWSILGIESLHFSIIECLIFGSTLSATDPVTILAIFQQYKVDPKLYSVIFGESILNDAVAIVMYETLSQFRSSEIYVGSIFHGVGIFFLSFSSSMALGITFGLLASLALKHSSLSLYPQIESCLVALVAYTSYFFSNGLHMSGIVSLLFCGITLKHYAYHTMSRRTQRTTKYLFGILAQLSENFIFIYLGMNLFTQDMQVFKPILIVVSVLSVLATRYAAVFPLSQAINALHRWRGQRHDELPHSYQMMLFWAGLRGAVGVALAAGFTGANKDALRTTVLVVVVLTVIMLGGTTARMLEVMRIRTGVDDGAGDSSTDEEERAWIRSGRLGHPGARWDERANARFGSSSLGGSFDRLNELRTGGRQHARRISNANSNANNNRGSPSRAVWSADEYDDSDGGDVLPLSTSHTDRPPLSGGGLRNKSEAWFHAIDERYLMPLFSNAVASRTFHARRANRRAGLAREREREGTVGGIGGGDNLLGADGGAAGGSYGSESESGNASPVEGPREAGGVLRSQEFVRSIGKFWTGPSGEGR